MHRISAYLPMWVCVLLFCFLGRLLIPTRKLVTCFLLAACVCVWNRRGCRKILIERWAGLFFFGWLVFLVLPSCNTTRVPKMAITMTHARAHAHTFFVSLNTQCYKTSWTTRDHDKIAFLSQFHSHPGVSSLVVKSSRRPHSVSCSRTPAWSLQTNRQMTNEKTERDQNERLFHLGHGTAMRVTVRTSTV